jgi:hypothetical protein
MALQYDRDYLLQLFTDTGEVIEITELRVVFEVTKNILGIPNLAEIKVFNMREDNAEKIKNVWNNVILYAGYKQFGETPKLIFKGEIRNVTHTRDGVDKIATIFAGDGQRSIQESLFSKAFEKGFNVKQMITEVAKSFGKPVDRVDGVDGKNGSLSGISLSGKTKDLMDRLADQYDLNWSIQDGSVTITGEDDADQSVPAVVISRSTGMIGSPTLTEIGADARTLMNPEISPNRLVKIESDTPEVQLGNLFFRRINREIGNGIFRVNKVIHKGDNRGNDWYSMVTGQRLIL